MGCLCLLVTRRLRGSSGYLSVHHFDQKSVQQIKLDTQYYNHIKADSTFIHVNSLSFLA